MKGNEIKKWTSTEQKKCQAKMKRKAPKHRSSNQKYLSCQEKSCLGIKLIFFCEA